MRLVALIVVAAALCLAGDIAGAADSDIWAMRGEAGDGKTKVNAVLPPWRGFFSGEKDGESAEARAFDRGEFAAPAMTRLNRHDYVGWKNTCVLNPPVIGEGRLEVEAPSGFGQVAPYLEKPPVLNEGFVELLVEELSAAP